MAIMDTDQATIFTDLAQIAIYHYCDVEYGKKAKAAARRLAKLGIVQDVEDGETAYQKYEEMLVEYVLAQLPTGYELTHDYWGAKCISNQGHGTKKGLFAGDSQSRIAWFNSFAALKEYTDDKLRELNHDA